MANPTIKDRRPPTQPAGGLHCAKGEPEMQMEAHHFCRQVNQDLIQCVLFDGNTKDATSASS